jgi:hypothetical protein
MKCPYCGEELIYYSRTDYECHNPKCNVGTLYICLPEDPEDGKPIEFFYDKKEVISNNSMKT